MTTFLALYRGPTVAAAELVALSADERLVRDFAERLITEPPERRPTAPTSTKKPPQDRWGLAQTSREDNKAT